MDKHERSTEHSGDVPSDTEGLAGDTAASDPLTTTKRVQPSEAEERNNQEHHGAQNTTSGKVTSPSFGSAVSGGALADPGPPRD